MNKLILILSLIFSINCFAQTDPKQIEIKSVVDDIMKPVMEKNNVPGMAVAVTLNGKKHFFNYGVASKENGQKVTENTIFEIGSISKTFTGTLASYAQVKGKLSFSDPVSRYVPELRGTAFDNITILNLGTYTSGGLPLQVPEGIETDEQLLDYYKNWQPEFAPGTRRVYSNPSIGLLGIVAARRFGKSFEDLMENTLFPKLGLKESYINVPASKMNDYAWGYSRDDQPRRVSPGVVDSEAYGVKSSSKDMIRFIEANMNLVKLDRKLKQAIADTHTGYFKLDEMTQDFIWEHFSYPAKLETILSGTSNKVVFEANPVEKIASPLPPQKNVYVHKTGSTAGFGGYVAFVPAKKIGIVLLANKNYPIDARITAAHQIINSLDQLASYNNSVKAG